MAACALAACDASGKSMRNPVDMGRPPADAAVFDMFVPPPVDMFVPPADMAALDMSVDAASDMAGPDLGSFDPGENCNAPLTASIGTTTTQSNFGRINDFSVGGGAGCEFGIGPDVTYQMSVPAGRRLRVWTKSATINGFDPAISLIAGPAATCRSSITCLDSANANPPVASGAYTNEYVEWTNSTAAAVTVFIVVDSASEMGGTFSLVTELSPAPCTMATNTGGVPFDECPNGLGVAENHIVASINSARNDYFGNECSNDDGRDVAFRFSVAAGRTLEVRVASNDREFDPSVYLVDAADLGKDVCMNGTASGTIGGNCIDGDDSGDICEENVVSYTNTTGSTRTVFAIVDTYDDEITSGTFVLTPTFL